MTRKYLPISEFRAEGYLQELNRQFLHPLGLALEVTRHEDGTEEITGVWDSRDDPEGFYFDDLTDADGARAAHVGALFSERCAYRVERLGYAIQPVPSTEP